MPRSSLFGVNGRVKAKEIAEELIKAYYDTLKVYDWDSFRKGVNLMVHTLNKKNNLRGTDGDGGPPEVQIPKNDGFYSPQRDMDGYAGVGKGKQFRIMLCIMFKCILTLLHFSLGQMHVNHMSTSQTAADPNLSFKDGQDHMMGYISQHGSKRYQDSSEEESDGDPELITNKILFKHPDLETAVVNCGAYNLLFKGIHVIQYEYTNPRIYAKMLGIQYLLPSGFDPTIKANRIVDPRVSKDGMSLNMSFNTPHEMLDINILVNERLP